MKLKDIKICVVGGGHWGKNHLSTLDKIGNLGGLVEKDNSLVSFYKKKYPYLYTYKSIESALEHNVHKGFVVATPAKTHFELTKKILIFGQSVLVEKPFSRNLKEAKILINLAEKKKLSLMVGHLLLFHGGVRKIKELLDKKTLGKINYIYINRINLGKVRDHEDVFWSLGPHDVAIINYLTDKFPTKVKSENHSFIQKNISDVQLTNFDFGNGLKAHIFNSWYNPFKEHRLVVIGSKGMIDFRDDDEKYLRLYEAKVDKNTLEILPSSSKFKKVRYKVGMPLEEELKYFIKNIKNNSKPEISGAKSAIEVTKIMSQA